MYETASKRVYKSKRCVLFMTFRPSQRTLFMARRNWVLLALSERINRGFLKQLKCDEKPSFLFGTIFRQLIYVPIFRPILKQQSVFPHQLVFSCVTCEF